MNISRIILIGCAVFAVIVALDCKKEYSETAKENEPVNVLDISEPHVVMTGKKSQNPACSGSTFKKEGDMKAFKTS
ncbi:hypothetical protein O9929_16375 [Vibrio lentus]|nr:hypothetical protein [Vibrio lentus]